MTVNEETSQIYIKSMDVLDSRVKSSAEKNMDFEKFRIESFKNWPVPYIDFRELAADGFFYTGFSDKVECNFCRLLLKDWEATDIPRKEHLKFAAYCPFVRGLQTGNIEIYKNGDVKVFLFKLWT